MVIDHSRRAVAVVLCRPAATSSGSMSHSRTQQASTAPTGYAAAVISGGGGAAGSNGAGARGTSSQQQPGEYRYAPYMPSNVDVKAARSGLDESRRIYSRICSAMVVRWLAVS